ncbi:hypothetical protein TRFO_22783 [Tritrichomonas foetus]|uniref:Homeobox domain-containing protein n=1 Tax=Tritrichomonas foetus TaxID=1144522 RepID=A0A1J4KC98_9EUKA|nr:hypothetical protein TRFO_22783 [Tritrichomonas foetus]|eukprot:OHT08602.1 hypothetical protein TRFO_22783 [Tritrichomonas foetus]
MNTDTQLDAPFLSKEQQIDNYLFHSLFFDIHGKQPYEIDNVYDCKTVPIIDSFDDFSHSNINFVPISDENSQSEDFSSQFFMDDIIEESHQDHSNTDKITADELGVKKDELNEFLKDYLDIKIDDTEENNSSTNENEKNGQSGKTNEKEIILKHLIEACKKSFDKSHIFHAFFDHSSQFSSPLMRRPPKETRKRFTQNQKNILLEFIKKNDDECLYPSNNELIQLSQLTDLTKKQIQTFFMNYRCRTGKAMKKKNRPILSNSVHFTFPNQNAKEES